MRLKKIMLAALLLLAIMTIGAASAADTDTIAGIDNATGDVVGAENDNQDVLEDSAEDITSSANDDEILGDPSVDLSISTGANITGSCVVGDQIAITLTAHNAGPDDATGAYATITCPSSLLIKSANTLTGSFEGYTWTIGNFASGETATLDLVCQAVSAGDDTFSSTITSEISDSNAGNNYDSLGIETIPIVDLAIAVASDVTDYCSVGDEITITLTASNNGPCEASDAAVTFICPPSMIVKSSVPLTGTYTDGVWNIGTLSPGSPATLYILCEAIAPANETLTATIGSTETDANTANNMASTEISIREGVKTFTDLSNLIGNASAGDIIELTSDYINNDSQSGYRITISKPMTIDGKGHTLDANATSGIFRIESDNVTIKNIVFENGNNSYGGAVSIPVGYKNNVILNCNFTNCSSPKSLADGGAIASADKITITKCNFINCHSNEGGAIYFWQGDNCTVSDCSFINCSAEYGGAINFISGDNDTVTNCSFSNCSASQHGGAIYSERATCSISDSNFTNCSGYLSGAIYTTTQSNNCIISNCRFIECFVDGGGCAIRINGDNSSVSNCNFINCSTHYGGAVIFQDSDNSSVSNCNFINCSSSWNNGALEFTRSDNCSVSNCNFINCHANYRSGAIYFWSSDDGIVSDCSFINCSAVNGGAIYLEYDIVNCSINNCSFEKCSAENGGAIFVDKNSTLKISGSKFENNTADKLGGALYLTPLCEVADCTFNGNSDPKIYVRYTFSDLELSIYNTSEGGLLELDNDYYYDDTTSNYGITISKSITIDGKGHALYALGTYTNPRIFNILSGNVTLKNIVFRNGQNMENGGGAVIITSDSVGSVISNCSFIDCEASGRGGAIIWMGNNGVVSDCDFINCSNIEGADWYEMLALFESLNTTDNATMEYIEHLRSLLEMNGTADGGAIYWTGNNGKIENTNFINSQAKNGGAVFVNETAALTISNSRFENNNASQMGGAIYARYGSVIDCSFVDCNSQNGGAIYYYGEGNISDCRFENCFANSSGGAIHFDNRTDYSTVSNSNFTNCSGEIGGSIYSNATAGIIEDSTFINSNAKYGKAIYASKDHVISNSRFVSENLSDVINGGNVLNCTLNGEIITKPTPEITATTNNVDYGEKATVSVTLPINATNNVNFILSKGDAFISNTTAQITNGTASCEFAALRIGTYDVRVEYEGDSTYMEAFDNVKFTVRPKVAVSPIVPENTSATIFIDFGEDVTSTLFVMIDSNPFEVVSISRGIVNETTRAVQYGPGNHTLTFAYIGNDLDKDVFSEYDILSDSMKPLEYALQVIPVEIPMPEETTTNREGSMAVGLGGNATGKYTIYVDGEKVDVILLNDFKESTQGNVAEIVNGILRIDLSQFGNGKHTILIVYSGNDEYHGFTKEINVTVNAKSPSITAGDMTALYSAGQSYTIKVYEDTGVVANRAAVSVNMNGKSFTIFTASNGVASFKVTQTPGTYRLTISSLGKTVTRTLKVKHIVTLKSVTVKKSAKKLILTATLAKVNKKYLKNKKITFKFNGKKYTAKTNKKGVAKVTVKASALKKLKVGKKVTYQATYLKDTVKKTVKIKK